MGAIFIASGRVPNTIRTLVLMKDAAISN